MTQPSPVSGVPMPTESLRRALISGDAIGLSVTTCKRFERTCEGGVERMAEQVVVVRSCPVCGEPETLVTMGRDIDSRGRLRREWVIEVDCANEACATHAQTS